MNKISSCPICHEKKSDRVFVCMDFTVSKEEFDIRRCLSCGFTFTDPRPDNKDLGKYYESEEYISHSNKKKGFISAVYQRVRRITLNRKLDLINKIRAKSKLLDIGCGTGEFLNKCKVDGWNVVGVEPSSLARKQCVENFHLDVKQEEELKSLPKNSFDVVTMWHVLEHVPGLNERIQEIKGILKDNGVLIIAVPNRNSFDADYYKEFWAAYDVPRHLWHFNANDMRKLMEKNEMKIEQILPMKFDSYYVSLLSEKNKTGKMNLLRAFINGWKSNRKAGKERYSSLIYIIRNQ
ncbi:MAG: class I SAM-dependent methyltransferase [Bacteroidetes bacterium]|nr:class I SAM-dependent methyltransferase [Bacteroidota bacterium]